MVATTDLSVKEPPGPGERLGFLSSARAWGQPYSASVEVIETHMAWVFLVGEQAYKLKKTVRYPHLDFMTLARREQACREELRLNERLAPGIYQGLSRLQWDSVELSVHPEEEMAPQGAVTLDWLVRMRRLPRERMLDATITHGALRVEQLESVAQVLAAFYRRLSPVGLPGEVFWARFVQEHRVNQAVLCRPAFALPQAGPTLDRFERALFAYRAQLVARAEAGRVVEGHGDLRPAHVCLLAPPVVIDALEFNEALRQVDPFDEAALLGVECAAAGAHWVGPRLTQSLGAALKDPPGQALAPFYRAYRALLRARLAAAHLLDAHPRTPQRWLPMAGIYLALAAQALDALEGVSGGETRVMPTEEMPGSGPARPAPGAALR